MPVALIAVPMLWALTQTALSRRTTIPAQVITPPDAAEAEDEVVMPDDAQVERVLRRVLSEDSDLGQNSNFKRARSK